MYSVIKIPLSRPISIWKKILDRGLGSIAGWGIYKRVHSKVYFQNNTIFCELIFKYYTESD